MNWSCSFKKIGKNEQDKATLSYRTRLFSNFQPANKYIISRCYFVILLLEIRNIVFNFLIVQHGQPNKRGYPNKGGQT